MGLVSKASGKTRKYIDWTCHAVAIKDKKECGGMVYRKTKKQAEQDALKLCSVVCKPAECRVDWCVRKR